MFQTASRPRALILPRRFVVVALAVGFALIFATAVATVVATRGLAAANHHIAQAHHALGAAASLSAALAEAAATADARDARARERFQLASARATAELATLTRSHAADPALHALGASLERRVADFITALAPPAPGREADDDLAQAALADVRALVATLERNQFARLAAYSTATAQHAETVQVLNVSLIALGGSLAVAVAVWLLARLRDLEGLITVCAWTRRVQWEGRWITFEEYLAKRFNLFCTHGICEEAAEKMKRDAANTPVPADFLQ